MEAWLNRLTALTSGLTMMGEDDIDWQATAQALEALAKEARAWTLKR